jgi:hypothetical protein
MDVHRTFETKLSSASWLQRWQGTIALRVIKCLGIRQMTAFLIVQYERRDAKP